MTTSDLDTYRTARLLLDQHEGDRDLAVLDAAMRSDQLLDSGDLEGPKVSGHKSMAEVSKVAHMEPAG